MNQKTKARRARQRRRVIQCELPSESIRRQAHGDWSRWEASARRALTASAKRIEATR